VTDEQFPERVFSNESPHSVHTRASENAHQQIVTQTSTHLMWAVLIVGLTLLLAIVWVGWQATNVTTLFNNFKANQFKDEQVYSGKLEARIAVLERRDEADLIVSKLKEKRNVGR